MLQHVIINCLTMIIIIIKNANKNFSTHLYQKNFRNITFLFAFFSNNIYRRVHSNHISTPKQ